MPPNEPSPAPAPEPDALGSHALPDGRIVRFRHLRTDDEGLIIAAFQSASPETVYHRFFSPLRSLSVADLRRYLALDPLRDACVIGALEAEEGKRIVCGARYVRSTAVDEAEIAVTVHDAFRRRGLGRAALERLLTIARERGVTRFTADVLESNTAMLALLRRVAPHRQQRFSPGICHLAWDLRPPMGSDLYI